jgi:hypothetical protein
MEYVVLNQISNSFETIRKKLYLKLMYRKNEPGKI